MVPNCKLWVRQYMRKNCQSGIRAIDKTNPPLLNSKERLLMLRRKEISDTVKK